MEAGGVVINRSTSLYLSGLDQFQLIRIRDGDLKADEDPCLNGNACAVFTVEDAPLINVFNIGFWPDPGQRQANDHPGNPLAFEFRNSEDTLFEMLDTFLTSAKIRIAGPGSFTFQNTYAATAGQLDAFIEIDHADADVKVVGGLFHSGPPRQQEGVCGRSPTLCGADDLAGVCQTASHPTDQCAFDVGRCDDSEVLCGLDTDPNTPDPCLPGGECVIVPTPQVLTTCQSTATESACNCGPDGCDWLELEQIAALCTREDPPPPAGCPNNPCGCESYHIRQKSGRLQVYSTAFIRTTGDADVRIDSPSAEPHIIANVRSEGPKGTTGYPPNFLSMPEDEPVDVVLIGSYGGWVGAFGSTGFYDEVGQGRFMDYNGAGTVWLIGNSAPRGAGRLAAGSPKEGATIVAAGNRYFGDREECSLDGGNGTCADGTPCVVDTDCTTTPTEMVPPEFCGEGVNCIAAGNMWSRGVYCNWWCKQNDPACNFPLVTLPTFCDPLPRLSEDDFVDFARDFRGQPADLIPELPVWCVPEPISPPPVNLPLKGMIDAAGDCRDNWCVGFYPNDCCDGLGQCPAGGRPPADPACWLQAALHKGVSEGKPVYLRAEGAAYEIDRPLYWVHSDQVALGLPLPPSKNYVGGWLVGQNNHVTIRNTDAEAVWTTEGMSHGVVQGISFETAPYSEIEDDQHSTVDIENNFWVCSHDPLIRCGGSNGSAKCHESAYCDVDTCTLTAAPCSTNHDCSVCRSGPLIGRQTAAIVFHDGQFKGGRHAFGICMESSTQCDTIMAVNGTFSDARIGWANGGSNALHNIAYQATFADNQFAMGHDEAFGAAGYANWSLLHGTIVNSTEKDIDLVGGGLTYYFHGLDSASSTVLAETETHVNKAWPIMFDQFNGVNNMPGPIFDYKQSIGLTFLHSNLGNGHVNLADSTFGCGGSGTCAFPHPRCVSNNDCMPYECVFEGPEEDDFFCEFPTVPCDSDGDCSGQARVASKYSSTAVNWFQNSVSEDSSLVLELEECVDLPPPCSGSCVESSCSLLEDTGDLQCVDRSGSAWVDSPCPESSTIQIQACDCVGFCFLPNETESFTGDCS